MIEPTVGRVVLFHPGPGFTGCPAGGGIPLPALICRVWSDTCINVGGFDANGAPFSATSVYLVHWCEWMPYQKAVASGQQAPTLHA